MTSRAEERLETIISQMTLDQKLAQLGSYWSYALAIAGQTGPDQKQGETGVRDWTDHPCGWRLHMGTGFAESVQSAEQAEALVLVLGDRSGLTPDCSTGEFR